MCANVNRAKYVGEILWSGVMNKSRVIKLPAFQATNQQALSRLGESLQVLATDLSLIINKKCLEFFN